MTQDSKLTTPLQRILVLGGSGLVGSALCEHLSTRGIVVLRPRSGDCDVRDIDAIRRQLREGRPDLLVNSAAVALVNEAEKDPARAFQVNALGAHNAALAAHEAGVPLMHISTDYVFDGKGHSPYREYDPTGEPPPNVYSRSKLQAELLVRHCCPRHFIVRVAAIYGRARATFVDKVLATATPASPMRVVADRFSSPTWADPLAEQLRVLAQTPFFGTYHVAGWGTCSFYEFARAALELSGRDVRGVVPVTDAELAGAVPRAAYTALDNHLLRLRGLETLPHWRDSLAAYVRAGNIKA